MKRYALPLLAAATLLLASCSQNPPADTEKAAAEAKAPEAGASDASEAAPGESGTPETAAAPAAVQNVDLSFRFDPVKGSDGPRSTAFLVMSGGEKREVDLGPFAGKPDVVDSKEAELAKFPKEMLMGFRSYDPNSGTSNDLAILPVYGKYLRIVQRKVEEGADKLPDFQTAREIPIPAGAKFHVAPTK